MCELMQWHQNTGLDDVCVLHNKLTILIIRAVSRVVPDMPSMLARILYDERMR
tara:strand:+ start:318 stop:476 length:159 start_codon:yes stop_codon:yes gene_type:complete